MNIINANYFRQPRKIIMKALARTAQEVITLFEMSLTKLLRGVVAAHSKMSLTKLLRGVVTAHSKMSL